MYSLHPGNSRKKSFIILLALLKRMVNKCHRMTSINTSKENTNKLTLFTCCRHISHVDLS